MALGLFMMFVMFILLVVVAIFIVGVILIIVGSNDKKKGGKGTKRIIGIVMVSIPFLLVMCIGARVLWYNVNVKCVADEWRYKPSFMPRNAIMSSSNMLRELLEAVDDNNKDLYYREFSVNVRNNGHFEDTVDDFFDDMENMKVDLDPDDFLKDYGKSVRIEGTSTYYPAGYIYSAEIDGETYYCYVRTCYRNYDDKNDVGLQQFIICTEDKVNELNQIIESGNVDIYLEVL